MTVVEGVIFWQMRTGPCQLLDGSHQRVIGAGGQSLHYYLHAFGQIGVRRQNDDAILIFSITLMIRK